jgi:4-amino-4-deoxy-L-arabinose transferase-like glycosyltransferase
MLVDGLPLLLLGLVGVVALRRDRRLLLPLVWLGACWLGFLAGGLYHPHYWVQMLAPLSLLAGAGAVRLVDAWPVWRGRFAVAVIVAIPLIAALPVYLASSPEQMSLRSTNDPRVISAIPVGAAIALETEPDQRVQVLWANAAVYWHADRIPRTRYMWYRNIEFIPGAREDVVRAFQGDAPPRVVVGYQPVEALDVEGRIQDVLAEDYVVTEVDGVPFWTLAR